MPTHTFYCWFTLMTEYQTDILMAELIKRNLDVGGLSATAAIREGAVSCLAALQIKAYRKFGKDEKPCAWLLQQVLEIVRVRQIQFYSLVVMDLQGNATWQASNIPVREEAAVEVEKVEDVPSTQTPAVHPLERMDKILD